MTTVCKRERLSVQRFKAKYATAEIFLSRTSSGWELYATLGDDNPKYGLKFLLDNYNELTIEEAAQTEAVSRLVLLLMKEIDSGHWQL